MKRIYVFLFVSLLLFNEMNSQVTIFETFEASTASTGWAYTGFTRSTSAPCAGSGSLRRNVYEDAPTASVTTPTWTSNGQAINYNYKYKILNYSFSTPTTATPNTPEWGKLITELSIDGGVSYTYQIDSVDNTNHLVSASCVTRSVMTIPGSVAPNGSICKIRIRVSLGNSLTPDYFMYIDDVSISQIAVSPPNCIMSPTTPINMATGTTSSVLTWPAASGSPTGYTIYVGTDGGGTTDPSNVTNAIVLGNVTTYTIPLALNSNTTYYWKVVPTNANGSATGCSIWSFTTASAPPCISAPTSPLNAALLTCPNYGTTLSWAVAPSATSYDVYFGTTLPTTPVNQTSLSFVTGTLLPSTTYSWQIVPKNSFGAAVGCAIWTFTTDAVLCYCITTPTNVNGSDIITNVTMGTLNNTSTSSANNFTSYSNMPVDLQQNTSKSISITFGSDGTQHSAVWIDFDQSKSFEASENVALSTSSSSSNATKTYSLTIPSTALLGQTTMRVRGGADGSYTASGACAVSSYGETEDYLVNIVAPPTCIAPTALTNTLITNTTANHSWTAPTVAPIGGYEWAVSTSTTPPTTGTATTLLTASSTGLMANTTYYLHVRSNCGATDGLSSWATSAGFKTLIANDFCIDAVDITTQIGTSAADTVGKVTLVLAGNEGTLPRPGCTGSGATGMNKDVWFKFTASNVMDSTIIYTGTNDWIAELYSACGSTMVLACSDDENSLGPVLQLCGLTNGQVYYIRLLPYSNSANTEMWIYKGGTCPRPPDNDACAGAITISNNCSMPTVGTLENSSASSVANLNCGGSSTFATQSDVWYKFTNSGSISQKINIKNIPTGKTYFGAIYTGTCNNNLTPVYCLNSQVADSIVTQVYGLMRDSVYYVRIWETAVPNATSTFDLCISDSTSVQTIDTTTSNTCYTVSGLIISPAENNTNGFVPLYHVATGKLIAEIDAQGNNLGAITYSVFRNTNAVRIDDLGKPYLDRNITISVATQPTSPVLVRFYFTPAERAALDAAVSMTNDRNDLRINRIEGACTGTAFGTGATLLNQYGNGPAFNGEYVEFFTSSFSQFFITKSTITLAQGNLESFTATKQGNTATINWKVAANSSAVTYEVLKSTDGRNFVNLTTLNAITNTRNYNALDASLVTGANYYKLKATDRSGAITYSAVAVVYSNAKGFEIVSLIPTLVRGNALASIGSDKATNATLIVTDMQGKTMLKKVIGLQAGTTDVTIDASKFAVGAYMLRAISSDGASNVIRFIKQ